MKNDVTRWTEENAPLGRRLGYPECCIKAFCDLPPEQMTGTPSPGQKMRYEAGCLDGKFTGFIPCTTHAGMIISGHIQLADLIQGRDTDLPEFPTFV